MKHHAINRNDLSSWLMSKGEVFASNGTKQMKVSFFPLWFEVTADDITVYSGADADKAINEYNSLE